MPEHLYYNMGIRAYDKQSPLLQIFLHFLNIKSVNSIAEFATRKPKFLIFDLYSVDWEYIFLLITGISYFCSPAGIVPFVIEDVYSEDGSVSVSAGGYEVPAGVILSHFLTSYPCKQYLTYLI